MLEVIANQSLSEAKTVSSNQSQQARPQYLASCSGCIAKEIGVCDGFVGAKDVARQPAAAGAVPSTGQFYPARRPIVHQREISEVVPIVCTGWAVSALATQNGKRQILSFRLGGEVASINYVFGSCSGRTVEAVSEVYCRKFRRKEFQEALQAYAGANAVIAKSLRSEMEWSDQLYLDLSRRSAEARIARLILSLSARVQTRQMPHDGSFEFPLRQQHIADATGLTAVHVCKILTRLRTAGLIASAGRRLRILDRKGLQEIADQ